MSLDGDGKSFLTFSLQTPLTFPNPRRHWLFGEKVLPETNGDIEHRKIRIRGWFPRQCAMEIYENDENEEHASKNGNGNTMKDTHCDLNRNGNAKKLN